MNNPSIETQRGPACRTEIVIRPFEQRDQADVRAIYRATVAANPSHYYRPLSGPQLPDDVATNFASPGCFLIAEMAGKIAGFCGLRVSADNPSQASCMNGVVQPEYQGQGIYKELFRMREQHARAHGVTLLLAITSSRNTKMLAFLRKSGFQVYEASPPIPNFVHLQKPLS